MKRQTDVAFEKEDILKAVNIVGSKSELARELSKNKLEIKVSPHMIWSYLNRNKYMNKFIKNRLDEIIKKK